jgi:hypothetical protein
VTEKLTAGRLPPNSAELQAPERFDRASEHGTVRIMPNSDSRDVSGTTTSDVLTAMTNEDSEFKVFNDFGIDKVAPQGHRSRVGCCGGSKTSTMPTPRDRAPGRGARLWRPARWSNSRLD